MGVCTPLKFFPNKLIMLTQETRQKTKYNIKKRLLKLPGEYYKNRYQLCLLIGITDRTLIRWIETKIDQHFSIPTDQFYEIAGFLDCNPTDLINMPDE